MKVALSLILALALQASVMVPATLAQPSCRFVLGFATLRELVGAQKVGSCLEDEHFNLENGNSEQHTTGGLMVWRKIDNFTAFTDGATSWINGPNGLQGRPNGERFSWERDPIAATPGASASAPRPQQSPQSATVPTLGTPTPTPAPSPPQTQLTPALTKRCGDVVSAVGPIPSDVATKLLDSCNDLASWGGNQAVDCYEDSLRYLAQARARNDDSVTPSMAQTRLEQCATAAPGTGLAAEAASRAGTPIQPSIQTAPRSSSSLPPPTPAPAPRESSPDPMLMSRCVTLAADMAGDLSRDLPVGSDAGGRAFESFLGICQTSVRQAGARGFNCFESAFRRAIRQNGQLPPGSDLAGKAAVAEYTLCMMAGSQ